MEPLAVWLMQNLLYVIVAIPGLIGIFVAWKNYRLSSSWLPTSAKITASDVTKVHAKSSTAYRPDISFSYHTSTGPHETGRYKWGAISFAKLDDAQALCDQYKVGKEHPAWYSQKHHKIAVLNTAPIPVGKALIFISALLMAGIYFFS